MPPYPANWEADVVLRDGLTAHVRPVTPEDAEAVIRFYAGVSDESKYFRFFAPYPRLSARDVEGLTSIDYDSTVVLVALLRGAIVGLVQYAQTSPAEAEVAFLVQDEHHGRGLASVLLEHLAEVARERGLRRFTADVLPENHQMLAVFRAAGYCVDSRTEDGVVSLSFGIDPTDASRAVAQEREHRAEGRSVARLLAPASVAVAGASRSGRGVGSATLRHLADAGFTGALSAVHPSAEKLYDVPAYPRFEDIPGGVELVVIAVPSDAVAGVVTDAAAAGARALVVVSEGFAETGTVQGRAKQRELLRLVRLHGMRLLGPNALGLLNTDPAVRLNASLSPVLPAAGGTAFFAQSGVLGVTLLENVARRGLGISSFVSAGNRADISGNDMLQYWEDDPRTSAVLLYLESIGNPRKFSRLARRVGHRKPVVAVRSTSATQGVPLGHAVRHTAVPQAAIEAMYEQAGVIGVDNIHEMFDVAQLLARQPVPAGPRVAIVGNSDPLSLLAAAACARYGLTTVGPRVNLGSKATGADLAAALAAARANAEVHSVVVTVARRTDGSLAEHIAAVAAASARGPQTFVATYVGLSAYQESGDVDREALESVPAYATPEDAVQALAAVTAYGEWRRRPDPGEPQLEGVWPEQAAELVDDALAGRNVGVDLDDAAVGVLLGLYGVTLEPVTEPPIDGRTDLGSFVNGTGGTARRVVIRTREDALFGPIVSFGLAGIASDVLGDVGFRIPPLTELDARELILSMRAAPLLLGEGSRARLDIDGLVDLLLRLGRLAYDVPDVAALDVTAEVGVDGVRVTHATCHLQQSAARVDRSARSLPDPEALDLTMDGSIVVGSTPGEPVPG